LPGWPPPVIRPGNRGPTRLGGTQVDNVLGQVYAKLDISGRDKLKPIFSVSGG
jgi:hypothetical protein